MKRSATARFALFISLLYALFASLWILFSDRLFAALITDLDQLTTLQTYKGGAFVIVTALLLYVLLHHELQRRQRAEEMVQEREARYRRVVEHMTDGLSILDEQGCFTYVNERLCEMLGYTIDEFLGQSVLDFFDEATQPFVRAQMASRREGINDAYELTWRRKDGAALFTIMSPQLIIDENGQFQGSFAVVTDITKRKQTEAALQESQRALMTLMSNLPGMAYRSRNDADWTMEFISEGCTELTGYPPTDLIQNRTLSYGHLIHPQDRAMVREQVQAALQRDKSFQVTYRITTATDVEKWVWEQGCGVYSADGELLALEGFITDATAQIQTRQMLETQVAERTQELSTLLTVQQAITSRLDLDVLQLIADEAKRFTAARLGIVYLLDKEDLYISVLSGDPNADTYVGYRMPVEGSAAGLAIRSGQAVMIDDAQEDGLIYADLVQRLQIKSYLAVPLISAAKLIGVIAVADKQAGTFDSDDERVLTMLASGAVISLENADLYQKEQARRKEAEQRRRIAESLRDTLAVLNANHPLSYTLDHIATQIREMLSADADVIFHLDHETSLCTIQAARGLTDDALPKRGFPLQKSPVGQMTLTRQPIIAPDIRSLFSDGSDLGLDADVQAWQVYLQKYYSSLLAVPLIVKDEVYGGIALLFREPHAFSEEEIALAVTFSYQVALAIENSDLRTQVGELAVAAERTRIAHDLHDSVTQALFAGSLVAEVLPDTWERDPDEAKLALGELRRQMRGALAEMRTLLVELRPSALTGNRLGDLLRQLTEAVTSRISAQVTLELDDIPVLPDDVHIAFYRIVQEALNNIVKHAQASQVRVRLYTLPSLENDPVSQPSVALQIHDDGRGFDPNSTPSGHMGVGIMQQRAEEVGATICVKSQPGQGTQIEVVWPGEGRGTKDE